MQNHSLQNFYFRKGSDQWRTFPSQCWKLTKPEFGRHLRPCVKKILWLLMPSSDGFQSSHYQESGCLFQFRTRMSRGLNKFCHAERTNICPSSMSCKSCQLMGHWFSNPVHISITVIASTKQRSHMQVSSSDHCERANLSTVSVLAEGQINAECVLASLANWCGVYAAIQFTSIPSTLERGHMDVMDVSRSDHCERTILFPDSILAKGQINEECLLRNVESWESWSLADTSDLVLGRAFVPNPPGASKNPVVSRNQVASSSSEQERAEDLTNLAMLEEQTFALGPS